MFGNLLAVDGKFYLILFFFPLLVLIAVKVKVSFIKFTILY
jgi:hypothetical protein